MDRRKEERQKDKRGLFESGGEMGDRSTKDGSDGLDRIIGEMDYKLINCK